MIVYKYTTQCATVYVIGLCVYIVTIMNYVALEPGSCPFPPGATWVTPPVRRWMLQCSRAQEELRRIVPY